MSQPDSSTGFSRGGRCGWGGHAMGGASYRASWRPLELVAMILGFVLFWPVGLAILAFKLWQMQCGHRGDLATFAQEKADWARQTASQWRPGQWASAYSASTPTGAAWNTRSSGNAAFDEWRAAELARLEQERRKLEDAEREFTEHIDELRRARDREEFERFMSARRNRNGQPPANA